LKVVLASKKWLRPKAKRMAAEDFFNRWAKVKPVSAPVVLAGDVAADGSAAPAPPAAPVPPPPLPTMEDVASLTGDSDYSRFMGRGVDQAVQRGAMKKLFTDPHYNIMDGLDIYIGDYNTFEPMPAAMLALLDHAKGVLDPCSMFEKPVMQMISVPKPVPVAELEVEPELASDVDVDADLDSNLEGAPEPEPEPEPEPGTAPQTDSESAPTSVPTNESGIIDPDIDADVEPTIEPEPDATSEQAPIPPPAASVTVTPLQVEPVAGIARPIHQSRIW
jgi:hypothetical protein